jgi:peroxiredoxin
MTRLKAGVSTIGIVSLLSLLPFACSQPALPASPTPTPIQQEEPTVTPTPTPTPTPPPPDTLVIKNVVVGSITDTSAVITWSTNLTSTSQLQWGNTWQCDDTTGVQSNMVLDHTVSLSNLKPNTTYYFKVKSVADKGQIAVSESSQEFNTLPPPDKTLPAISSLQVSYVSDVTVVITWKTDEKASGQVEFGTTLNYGHKGGTENITGTDHKSILTGLLPSTAYHFRVKSADIEDNLATSDDFTFTTKEPVYPGYSVGDRVQNFTLTATDNKSVSLSDYYGKNIVMTFWSMGCGACKATLPLIDDLYRSITDNATKPNATIQILTVDLFNTQPDLLNFMKTNNYVIPVVTDSDAAVCIAWGVYATPTTFFINFDGIIMTVKIGTFADTQEIKDTLAGLQN